MSTTITRWGNSSGVRIPSKELGESRFALGDVVELVVNARGNIEIIEPQGAHRKAEAPGRLTSAELYERYPVKPQAQPVSAWPSDDMVGAEWDAWSK